jgi:hypothetical protein
MNDILDLRFKKKISNTIIDDFRIISNSNIKNFFKLIDNESKLNHDNLDWWVSSASTRNTIISPLYHNYCILVLLKNKNEIYFKTFDKIITNSNIIYKFLIKKYPYLKNKILIKQDKNINLNIRIIYLFFYFIFRKFFISLFAKNKVIKNNSTLIDIFSFNNQDTENIYFTNLRKFISNYNYNEIVYIPTFIDINIFKLLKNIIFQSKKKNFFLKENFLSYSDILYSLNHFYRLDRLSYSKSTFGDLVKEENSCKLNLQNAIDSICTYRFIRKLKIKNLNFKKTVNWFENQINQRTWNLAFSKYFPKTNRIGYNGIIPVKMYLSQYYITHLEQFYQTIPNKIFFLNDLITKDIIKYNSKLPLYTGPSLRFTYLFDLVHHINQNNSNIILVALPIIYKDCISIIDLIDSINLSNYSYKKYCIKFHPTHTKKTIKNIKQILPATNFSFTTSSNSFLLKSHNIVITGMSSFALEALVLGKTVIIIDNYSNFDFNPIPEKISKNSYYIVKTKKDLLNIFNLLNNNKYSIKVKEDIDQFFMKPNKQNISELLSLK